jgi:hypothetical protein
LAYYAGIGSRDTPDDVLDIMKLVALNLAIKGYILRSGGADGADLAFEEGAYRGFGKAEIYLPWKSFNKEKRIYEPTLYEPAEWTFEIAEKYHPSYRYLKRGAKLLHARNVHQIFGETEISYKTDFVLCWTKDGKGSGGTGQAIRIANDKKIPVLDMGNSDTLAEVIKTYLL